MLDKLCGIIVALLATDFVTLTLRCCSKPLFTWKSPTCLNLPAPQPLATVMPLELQLLIIRSPNPPAPGVRSAVNPLSAQLICDFISCGSFPLIITFLLLRNSSVPSCISINLFAGILNCGVGFLNVALAVGPAGTSLPVGLIILGVISIIASLGYLIF